MGVVTEPSTGLQFVELSHRWGYNAPTWPGFDDLKIHKAVNHAQHGVMTQIYKGTMHISTHIDAPLHLVQGGPGIGKIPLERFFGNGVVLSVPKKKWELIVVDDLERAAQKIEEGDIIVIVTGWHKKYGDSKEYFGHAPGMSEEAAAWLVKKGVRLVGIDMAAIDHPLATSLGPHRNGPLITYLIPEYRNEVGREAKDDFPKWNVAAKTFLNSGIPIIQNVGGDVGLLLNKRCTFQAYPWNWPEGDACVVRFVAIHDPSGSYRIEKG